MMSLVKLLVIIVLIGHICACVWHGVAFYSNENSMTWIKYYDLSNTDSAIRYNYSFYWVIMTMTTIGYGGKKLTLLQIDIVP